MIQRIWINRNGEQSGPYTLEELQQQGPLTRETYVWFKGMADWQRATDVPELAHLTLEEIPEIPTEASDSQPNELASDVLPEDMPPVPQFASQSAPMPGPQYAQQVPAELPKRPPHNLFWSAVALIFCCSIPAIVAIIYGAQVSSKYNQGDYAKAQKYSDISAWWCIAAIVLGVLSIPVSIAISLL